MTPRFSLLALIAITLLGCYVILDSFIHYQRDKPGCQMSYSRPTFIPIPVPQSRLTGKYTLYLYREGGIDPPNQLQGVPTLFIPGHAGSYKQARSIAAESAYYYQGLSSKNYRYGLDVFTVDLNEEFSAIDGGLIQDQAEYLNDAIKHILLLYQPIAEYQGRPIPSSVLVVGHSMGGVVARVMQHLPNYVSDSINTIFTLATPHTSPPIILEPILDLIYRRFLSQPLNNTMLISVAGGTQDTIVNSDAAILSPASSALTEFTTAIPGVWTGCDHMAILWCNQLVKKVAAALVDITDIRSPSQTVPTDHRMRIFQSYLSPSYSVTLDSEWSVSYFTTDAVQIDGTKSHYLQPQNRQQLVYSLDKATGNIGIITNIQQPHSLRARLCKTGYGDLKCLLIKTGFHMLPSSDNRKTQPSETGTSPLWLLDLDHAIRNDFDVLMIDYEQESNKGHFIQTGMYASTTITTRGTEKFGLLSFWNLAFNQGIPLQVNSQHIGSIFHLPVIRSPLLAFKLSLVTGKTTTSSFSESKNDNTYQPLVQQYFYGESKFHIINSNSDDQAFAPIHFHRTFDHTDSVDKDGLMLTIWPLAHDDHDSPRTLHLLLQLDWYGSIGKCVLRLGPALPMCLFVVALSFLAHQLSSFSSDTQAPTDLAGSLANWQGKGKYSFSNVCFLVILAASIQQAWPEQIGSDWLVGSVYALPVFLWWIPLGLFLLAAGILAALSVLLSLLIYGLQRFVPRLTSASPAPWSPRSIHLHVWVVLIIWLGWLPTGIVFVIFYLQWLILCISSYSSARLSGNPSEWVKYRCLFAVFMVLTTWLPYHIPNVVIYVRDLMVGWHRRATLESLMNDTDVIVTLGIIYTIGYYDGIWKSRTLMSYLSKVSFGFTLYYTLVGIQHPFTLHHLVTSILK